MKRFRRRREGKSGLELIEEATHLLRTMPVGTLATYYVGAIPFVIGLLFFWIDMSRNPFGAGHLIEGSFAVTLLFLWMKFWQAVFARRLRAQLEGLPAPPWTARRCGRLFLSQAILQPIGLLLFPFAMVLVLPFAWVYAFQQNITALADSESVEIWKLVKKSWRQATLWPDQTHFVLMIMFFFALCVLLNWTITSLVFPQFGKMLFGMESVFTRHPLGLLNSTFFTAMIGLTYLSLDPILKTVCALRCFYGESLETGADLRAELKQLTVSMRTGGSAALLLIAFLVALPAKAAEPAPEPPAPSARSAPAAGVAAHDLDRAIDDVIQERKYTWRVPRDKAPPRPEKSALSTFVEDLFRKIAKTFRAVKDWVEEWLRRLFHRSPRSDSGSGSNYGWIMTLNTLFYVLIAAAAITLVWLIYRWWRRGQSPTSVSAEAMQPTPDLTDENIGADQLPEDGWTRLARELLEKGELRLALRAFYLASLAHLAGRNLIQIARSKSNREYELELRRRGHSLPDLLSRFGSNVQVFERTWYGMHDTNRDLVEQFAESVEQMKGPAA